MSLTRPPPRLQSPPLPQPHPLRYTWALSYLGRQKTTTENKDYSAAIEQIATFASVENFWNAMQWVKGPGEVGGMSDLHMFKQGIKPIWEDPRNINGGKWIVRLRKGLAHRLWEDLIIAMISDQFDVGDEICGCVISIRNQEDIVSVWNMTEAAGKINLRIKDIIKKALGLPPDTIMEYKAHREAITDGTSFRNAQTFK